MRKLPIVAHLSAIALAACGSPEPATDNLDTANLTLNVMIANEVAAANGVSDEPETEPEAPAAPAPAPAPTVAAKLAPKPSAPKLAETQAGDRSGLRTRASRGGPLLIGRPVEPFPID